MPKRLDYLFYQYINNMASPAELEEFYNIVDKGAQEGRLEKLIDQTYGLDQTDENAAEYEYYPKGAAPRMLNNIFAADSKKTSKDRRVKALKLWTKLAIATAVATVIVSTGVWFLNKQDKSNSVGVSTAAIDVAPAKQGATLTLSNGKKIRLSEVSAGQLASESGINISKTNDGQVVYEINSTPGAPALSYHTLSTAKGETYQLRLPDGSQVWLNAASSLTFAPDLDEQGKRHVRLEGEAYFEIAKDKQHPFIVESNGQQIEVLGTHFNVNSYREDKATKTTLLEGSLRVSVLNAGKDIGRILRPGEASVVIPDGSIKVDPADIKAEMSWKNGFFRFNQLTVDQVMVQLARWYAIDVVYDGKMPDEKFSGVIARNKNISEVLAMLSYTKAVKFKVEGRRVTVMK